MQGKIAGLLNQQPNRVNSNELPPIEQINSALMDSLTEREYDILQALNGGLTYKEIAKELFISKNTVNYHLKNIYSKLEVNNRLQAVQKVRKVM